MFEKKLYVVMTNLGEMIAFTTEDTEPTDDTNDPFLIVEYPATLIPREQGQLGLQMTFPFSNYDEPLKMRKEDIRRFSVANDSIKQAYDGWLKQVKAQLSGIVVPNAQVANPNDLRAV